MNEPLTLGTSDCAHFLVVSSLPLQLPLLFSSWSYKALMISGGSRGAAKNAPQSIVFHFHAVFAKNYAKQGCIPVGCVPSACCPYLPAVHRGVYLVRGVYLPGGTCPGTLPLWREWLTDRCKNINLPQTSFAGGNNRLAPPSAPAVSAPKKFWIRHGG